MPERIASDGGTVLELRQTEAENLPPATDGKAVQFYWHPTLGLQTKEFGKDAVNPISVAADAAQAAAIAEATALLGGLTIKSGSVDPTALLGVAATAPALYVRSSDGSVWSKTGAGNTAWTQLAFAS